ncbi:TraX family protein [Cellulosilyticum ruminicola]|uniref:TraX family protein n=1 Tax=Cellulosilyticum ruminicola TaxID=425254 RepID=UPI0009F91CAA
MLYFSIWQLISIAISIILDGFCDRVTPIFQALSGNVFYNEGGLPFVLLGVFLYLYKNHKKSLSITYIVFCISYFSISYFSILTRITRRICYYLHMGEYEYILYIPLSLLGFDYIFITPISMEYLLNYNYQCAMIFALPFMLLYNNQKGKGLKYFFYLFYPLHIIILFYLGNLLAIK